MIAKLYTSPFWVPLPCWPLPARRSSGAVHIKPKGATVRWADENLLRVAHLVYFALKIWNRKVLVRKMAGTMSCVQGQRHFSLAVSLWPWSVKEHMYQHIVRGAWSKSYPGGVQFIQPLSYIKPEWANNQNKQRHGKETGAYLKKHAPDPTIKVGENVRPMATFDRVSLRRIESFWVIFAQARKLTSHE